MRPTGSWSSWRSGAARSSPRRRRAGSSRCGTAPVALARSLLAEVVDADARLAWNGDAVSLASPLGADLLLEDATYVVVDLETTGLRPGSSQICEIGAVRVAGFEIVDEFETLVDPRERRSRRSSPRSRGSPTAAARRAAAAASRCSASSRSRATRCSSRTTRASTSSFLDRETERLTGSRLGDPVIDTVSLARRLLGGRVARRVARAPVALGRHVGEPCHRALPDAQATAEVLLRADRARAGARRANSRRPRRARGDAHAARVRQAASRARRAAAAGRLRLPRPQRDAAVRRASARPARAPALVLPLRPAAAGGRGGARCGRARSSGASSAPSSRPRSRSCG